MSTCGTLSAIQDTPSGLTVYDRVEPMQFIDTVGKIYALTGAGGAKNENEGKLLALACLCKRMDIFQISNEYHLMSGKLTMKADVMLAKFRLIGGDHEWIDNGENGQKAELRLTYKGKSEQVKFTLEQAKDSGFNFKDGSNWRKDPPAMLRARCITRCIKMLCPEVAAGIYTPEEIEDYTSPDSTASTQASPETVKKVKERAKELKDLKDGKTTVETTSPVISTPATQATPATASASPEVIDAVVESQAPFDAPGSSKDATLMEIEQTILKLGTTKDKVEATLKSKDPSFTTIDDMSESRAAELLAKLVSNLERINAAKAAAA